MAIIPYNTKITPDIEFQFLADFYHLEFFAFIPSGMEYAFARLLIDGILRVDGKLIVGELETRGHLKISRGGEVEIERLFTL
ncbi:MAG: hypothetical protein DDT22_01179 [candidate division WS2 bacterium]|nr:hypothetical protein [Candidatus Lithacetigena glycinireducens]